MWLTYTCREPCTNYDHREERCKICFRLSRSHSDVTHSIRYTHKKNKQIVISNKNAFIISLSSELRNFQTLHSLTFLWLLLFSWKFSFLFLFERLSESWQIWKPSKVPQIYNKLHTSRVPESCDKNVSMTWMCRELNNIHVERCSQDTEANRNLKEHSAAITLSIWLTDFLFLLEQMIASHRFWFSVFYWEPLFFFFLYQIRYENVS